MANFFSVNYSSCREGPYAYDDKSTRSRDFLDEDGTAPVKSDGSSAKRHYVPSSTSSAQTGHAKSCYRVKISA
ncbi:unnamed protein product [Lasius platythorax]|uniref:Uncharacterized protein n=1 Tax=Lasius platythorax TaxID=488582 RepID=A0AAV2NAT5_9HYME